MTIIVEPLEEGSAPSNGIFSKPTALAPQSKARSVDINNLSDAVDAAFLKLPSETTLKGGTVTFGVDAGAANAIVTSIYPATLTSLSNGMSIRVRVALASTSTTPTLNLNNLGAIGITRRDGSPLAVGEIPAGITEFSYDASLGKWTMAAGGPKGDAGPASVATGVVAIGAASTIVGAHAQKIVDLNGTFALSFAGATTLGAGFHVWLRNIGTGDITLDPAGTETIDGRTSFVMYPGEARLVMCDGATLRSFVIQSFRKTITSTQNFIKPPGYHTFGGTLWGAGASGGAGVGARRISGSAGAAAHPFLIPATMLADVELVTIAASTPGVSVAAANGFLAGTAGGQTTFAGLVANGGQPGGATDDNDAASVAGGAGGAASNTVQPAPGGDGGGVNVSSGARPGNSTYLSGAGSGAAQPGLAAVSGTSKFGGNAGAGASVTNGAPSTASSGAAPGGAGGVCLVVHPDGTSTTATSGAGARGELQIWGIA